MMSLDSVVITTEWLRWIVLIPLLGAFLNGVLVRPKRIEIAASIGVLGSLGAFIVSVIAVAALHSHLGQNIVVDRWFHWFGVGRVQVPFELELTAVTAIMLFVITGIGTLIHVFAASYMSHDKTPHRFFCYLNLFLAAMLVLVLSSNLVGVFLGWEGVGLCSYLLIGYWFHEDKNAAAGMKAFVTNRVGDLGFLVALFVAFTFAGTSSVRELVSMATGHGNTLPAWAWLTFCGALVWAATGKSAQAPLYVWLPDAMAGPTPVSALIHAATMVTSGIFVCVRLWPVFAATPDVLPWILGVGLVTAWIGALTALKQNDIKKVLAYSTVSQLGFMFIALGLGSPTAALFHVITHACFKALLFLGAGSVIHGMHEKQDLSQMGGLRKKMPYTHWTFAVGTAAIIGFPLSSGFFSKDMILAKAAESSMIVFVLVLGAALVTAYYMLRAYTLAFWGSPRSKEAEHAHESGPLMIVPLGVLAVLSVFVGWIETPPILGGIHQLDQWIKSSWYGALAGPPVHHLSIGAEILLVLVVSGASLGVAWYSYKKHFSWVERALGFWGRLFQNKFYVDELYERLLLRTLSVLASWFTRVVDLGIVNGFWHGARDGVKWSGQILSLFHSGSLQTYVFFALAALVVAIAVVLGGSL